LKTGDPTKQSRATIGSRAVSLRSVAPAILSLPGRPPCLAVEGRGGTCPERSWRSSPSIDARRHPARVCEPRVLPAGRHRSSQIPRQPARHKVSGWLHANPLKTNDRAMRSSTHFFKSGLPVSTQDRAPRSTASRAWEIKRAWEISPTTRYSAPIPGPHHGTRSRRVVDTRCRDTNHGFLIDTKTIRNRSKPLKNCSLRFSNRHSLGLRFSESGTMRESFLCIHS
jgi:hypothetical protein